MSNVTNFYITHGKGRSKIISRHHSAICPFPLSEMFYGNTNHTEKIINTKYNNINLDCRQFEIELFVEIGLLMVDSLKNTFC